MERMKKLYHKVDFCVVGGGIAGICAAISPARPVYVSSGTNQYLATSDA